MSNHNKYQAKAGKFTYDQQSKKVKVSKDKGKISIHTNQQGQTYFNWINLDKNIQQLSIIVFPFDAIFQKIPNQNNTYLLKFQSNQDKYFFYLQQKINPEEFVKTVNEKIAYVAEEVSQPMEVQQPVVAQKKQTVPQPKVEQRGQGLFNMDFIRRLQQNLTAAKGNQNDFVHLSQILTPQTINNFLTNLTPQQKSQFLDNLPQQQKDINYLASNIRSPQFQQAVDALTDALNSQNAIPLFMELGLDQKYLKKHYGVHAFLKAMEQWGKKQQNNQQ